MVTSHGVMTAKESGAHQRHVDVVRGDDTYRFFEDGSVELTRTGVGTGVAARSIQDENIIQKDAIDLGVTDLAPTHLKLGRTDIAIFGADSKLKEFRTTAAPGAVFDGEGDLIRGGPPEVKASKKRWKEIATELKYLEGYIADNVRKSPEVERFLREAGGGGGGAAASPGEKDL